MKKFVNVLLIFAILFTVVFTLPSCESSNDPNESIWIRGTSLRDPDTIPERHMPRMLFVHIGYWWHTGERYPLFHDRDLEALFEMGVNEICISFGADPMSYRPYPEADLRLIVSPEDIDAIQYTDRFVEAETETEASEIRRVFQNEFARSDRHRDRRLNLNDMAQQAIDFAERLVSLNPDVKIWIMIPNAPFVPVSQLYIDPFIEHFYNPIKEALEGDIWDNNVVGFYFGKEEIAPLYSGFNTENLVDFDNATVYLMRRMSGQVRADGKLLMWAPFTGTDGLQMGSIRALRTGWLINHTDIFDFAVLQPNTLFYTGIDQNLGMVRRAMEENAFINANDVHLGGPKTSSTYVGVVVEFEGAEFMRGNPRIPHQMTSNESRMRGSQYITYYRDLVGQSPFAFYAGPRSSIVMPVVFERLRPFWDETAEGPDDYVWPPEDDE